MLGMSHAQRGAKCMSDIFLQFEKVDPTTFAVLSSFLTISLFFKFNRFWSARNLDIVLMILLAPGLLLINQGRHDQALAAASYQASELPAGAEAEDQDSAEQERQREQAIAALPDYVTGQNQEFYGFLALWGVGALLLVRMLLDATMVRRPLLEPNLTAGGLVFLSICLFTLMAANVIMAGQAYQQRVSSTPVALSQLESVEMAERHAPGFALLETMPVIPVEFWLTGRGDAGSRQLNVDIRLVIAIVLAGHLLIVIGMVLTSAVHFHNFRMGIGAATLYLMLPYTFQMAGQASHVIPGALLVWAIFLFRRPLLSGTLIGLSLCIYYPLFLVPLWVSYYWRRGLWRFISGLLIGWAVLAGLLLLETANSVEFFVQLKRLFGIMWPRMEGIEGVWNVGWDPVYRLPILAAFVALCGTLVLWPTQKNMGTLLACTAAVMVATRFWHGQDPGLNMAWYLPLLLLTIMRPNLEDRIALNMVSG
jgi:hypothetical protein